MVINSKAASALSFALWIGSLDLSHKKFWVADPKGSVPRPQKECQYATANLKWSLRVYPATTRSGL